jgi:hypothetical protein
MPASLREITLLTAKTSQEKENEKWVFRTNFLTLPKLAPITQLLETQNSGRRFTMEYNTKLLRDISFLPQGVTQAHVE